MNGEIPLVAWVLIALVLLGIFAILWRGKA